MVISTLELLREGYSPDQIQEILLNRGIRADVGAFCRLLAEKGLLVGERPETPKPQKRWADLFGHLRALSWEIFSIPLESLHGRLDTIARWFLPFLIVSVVLSTLAVWLWGGWHWATMQEMARFSRQGYNILLMLAINGFAIPFFSRFFFNVLPILPMTDGYALLSQGAFREIDIRGRAGREFRRWRQREPNRFRGKHAFFYLFNAGVALFILGSGLWQLNGAITSHLRPLLPALVPGWTVNIVMVGIDLICLYLLRNRLRVLLAW